MMGATPATLTMSEWTTPRQIPPATPASTALPPASRTRKAASAAGGGPAAAGRRGRGGGGRPVPRAPPIRSGVESTVMLVSHHGTGPWVNVPAPGGSRFDSHHARWYGEPVLPRIGIIGSVALVRKLGARRTF